MKKLLFLFVLLSAAIASQAQWTMQSTGFPQASVGIEYIHAANQNVIWATGFDGSGSNVKLINYTHTSDGGATWTAGDLWSSYQTFSNAMIFGLDANTAWMPIYDTLGTAGGRIVKTSDGGLNWVEQSTATFAGPGGFPNVVHFWSAEEGFCMGDPNGGYFEIYTTADGGDNWVRVPQANIPAFVSGEFGIVGYYSVVGNTVWFGTNKGRVFKSSDKGLNWTAGLVAPSWGTVYVDVDFLDLNHGIAHHRGNGAGVATGDKYETFDGGASWSLIVQTGPLYLSSFAWVPGLPNTMVATSGANDNPGIAYSPDGGHTWTDFDDTTSMYQFLATAWADNTHGWAGYWTDATNPATVGGMWNFTGTLTDILNIDPKEGGAKFYPNPGNGNFTCAIIGFENKDVNISIYNAVGQKVYENNVRQSLISFNEHIDISGLGSGLYVAHIQSGNKVITEKLCIR